MPAPEIFTSPRANYQPHFGVKSVDRHHVVIVGFRPYDLFFVKIERLVEVCAFVLVSSQG